MFQKEAEGLELLSSSNSFRIPKVLGLGTIQNMAYLLLEFIPSGSRSKDFSSEFAQKLVALHQNAADTFGLDHDNYIGSLVQYNRPQLKEASEFYIERRIKPQIDWAGHKGFTFKGIPSFYKNLEQIIPKEKPSLIHGDLWGGNYLVDSEGLPVLIDPAVAYAPREMDLGMMKLFGGFESSIFQEYHELFPMEKDWESRIPIWQLYYLLVHLNLFGSSYYASVNQIIQKFN